MRQFLTLLCTVLIFSLTMYGQDTLYAKKSEVLAKNLELRRNIAQLRRANAELDHSLVQQTRKISQLQTQVVEDQSRSQRTADSIRGAVTDVAKTAVESKVEVGSLRQSLNQHAVMWVVAILGLLLFGVVIFGLLKRGFASGFQLLDKKIDTTKLELETKAMKLDQKVVELLGAQLLLFKDERPRGSKQGDALKSFSSSIASDLKPAAAREDRAPAEEAFVQCHAVTKGGKRCTRKAVAGSQMCAQHAQ
jgi:hypothetical protein